jgi:hypothetical protein
MKKLSKVLIFASILLIIICFLNGKKILAILDLPKTRFVVENTNSPLLNLLLLPDDLPDEFTWYEVIVTQASTPSGEGVAAIDGATAILGGFYDGKDIGLVNQIKEYNSNDTNKILDASHFNAQFSSPLINEFSDLQIMKISDIQNYRCLYTITNETTCLIGLVRSGKVITLDIKIAALLDAPSLKEILSTLIVVINKKLE